MPRRHRLTPADLSPEQLAAAGLSVPARGVLRSPHTGRGAKRGPSALELRYASHLETRRLAGEIAAYAYEPITVALVGRARRYRPDYMVSVQVAPAARWGALPSVPFAPGVTLVEVKPRGARGRPYWTQASRARWLDAAALLSGLVVVLVAWPQRGGGWAYEEART